jgi:hypothetical protein
MNKKEKAIILRKRGQSLAEIAEILKISKSTASVWLQNVKISKAGQSRLRDKVREAQINGGQVKHRQKLASIEKIRNHSQEIIKSLKLSKTDYKVFSALLYWCEGSKDRGAVCFMNSDPSLIKTFLLFLRQGFQIDESKFRVCLHLHKYHQSKQEIKYWSRIAGIASKQFLKIYQKENTGKRQKENYHGCASVRYHDVKVLDELKSLYELLFSKCGRLI